MQNNQNEILFSMACSHSGHTLISYILNAHSRIIHLGDTVSSKRVFRDKKCSCGKRCFECEFWKSIFEWEEFPFLQYGFPRNRLEKTVFSTYGLSALQGLLVKRVQRYRRYRNVILAFSEKAARWNQGQNVILGRKRLVDLFLMVALKHPIRIIHVSKDPLSYVHSCVKRRNGGQYVTKTIAQIARHWNRYNYQVARLGYSLPQGSYLHVKYENFCTAPERYLAEISELFGVESEPDMMTPRQGQGHLIGARSIVGRNFAGIKRPRTDAHSFFTPEERVRIWSVTARAAELLGYLPPGGFGREETGAIKTYLEDQPLHRLM